MRQVMHSPERPLQLIVHCRRQLSRVHVGSCNAIIHSVPDRHHDAPAHGAAAENVALRCADKQRNADLAPVIGDQLKHIRIHGAFARCFDGDLGRPPVREQASAVLIAILQSGLVKQRIGLDPDRDRSRHLAYSGLNRGLSGKSVSALGYAETVKYRHVDFVPVDGKRQSPPHPHIAKQRTPDVIAAIEIGQYRDARAARHFPQINLYG